MDTKNKYIENFYLKKIFYKIIFYYFLVILCNCDNLVKIIGKSFLSTSNYKMYLF